MDHQPASRSQTGALAFASKYEHVKAHAPQWSAPTYNYNVGIDNQRVMVAVVS